jgi:hypothetical protein
MSFQWLQMRITEEKERREREAMIRERLPRALDEAYGNLKICIGDYAQAFGADSAEIHMEGLSIRINVREEIDGKMQQFASIEVSADVYIPGFRITRGADQLVVVVGMLPGDKLFYRDSEKYLTMEELTRRILDRAFFPKLTE